MLPLVFKLAYDTQSSNRSNQEVEMYTRNVSLKLKANPFSASEFADILDRDIIPLLRKQKGFHEAISFIAAERNEAVAISFWDKKDSADAYHRKTYPQVLKGPVESG